MDKYLIYFAPYAAVGLGVMLAPFVSDRWPAWLLKSVEWCAEMVNGIWVSGVVAVILISLSVPVPAAALLALPVMYFSGRYFARASERMDESVRDIKRRGWEAHRKKEAETRTQGDE